MVPLTCDRGLAGAFNANVIRAVAALHRRAKRATPPAQRGHAARSSAEGPRLLPPPQGDHRPRAAPAPTARDRARRSRARLAHIVIARLPATGAIDARLPRLQRVQVRGQQQVVVEPLLPVTGAEPARAREAAVDRRDRLPLRAVEGAAARRAAAAVRRVADLPRPARVDGVGVRRAHDRDGQRDHATPRR